MHIDHSVFNSLLKKYVHDGLINYNQFKEDERDLDRYLDSLAGVEIEQIDANEKLALFINAYNAYTIKAIISQPILPVSIITVPFIWNYSEYIIGGNTYSLDEMERLVLCKEFNDPRVNFAIVHGSLSSPPLRPGAYLAADVDNQLDEQTRLFLNNEKNVRFTKSDDVITLHISRLFEWHCNEFMAISLLPDYISHYNPGVKSIIESGSKIIIEYLPYDWSLNNAVNHN